MNGGEHRIILEGVQEPYSSVIDRRQFRRYSRGLHSLIEVNARTGRTETHIPVPSIFAQNDLVNLIEWINRGTPSQQPDAQPLDFNGLVGLSIAIWKYSCYPDLFSWHVGSRQDELRPQELLGAQAAGWTFIALVFGWPESFDFASRELVIEFTSNISRIDGVRYFPTRLKAAVRDARLEIVRRTFTFIKDTVVRIHLTHPPTFNRIAHQLREAGVDISGTVDAYASTGSDQCLSPKRMLNHFDEFLLVTPQEGQVMEEFINHDTANTSSGSGRDTRLSLDRTDASTESNWRGGLRGNAAVLDVSFRKGVASWFSRRSHPTGSSPTLYWGTMEILKFDGVARQARSEIEQYKQEVFRGLTVTNFQDLRDEHLILAR